MQLFGFTKNEQKNMQLTQKTLSNASYLVAVQSPKRTQFNKNRIMYLIIQKNGYLQIISSSNDNLFLLTVLLKFKYIMLNHYSYFSTGACMFILQHWKRYLLKQETKHAEFCPNLRKSARIWGNAFAHLKYKDPTFFFNKKEFLILMQIIC